MSRAVVFHEYGGPDVLRVVDLNVPEPAAGQLRIRNRAAGLQPFDALFRSGRLQDRLPARFPQQLGNEFAGVVDAVGADVTGVQVGDEVLGWTNQNAYADRLLTEATNVVRKPTGMPWPEAGVLSASGQTASTALEVLNVQAGETVLVHAAAGGMGHFAVQLARLAGARVIGTASLRNHDFLRELGAEPVEYGPGLADRVRSLAPQGVTASLVGVGTEEAFRVSQAVTADPTRVVSVVFHPLVAQLGVRHVSTKRSAQRLQRLVEQVQQGQLKARLSHLYPLSEVAEAHRVLESGHGRGKLALSMEWP